MTENDITIILLCLYTAGVIVFALAYRARQRRHAAARWAAEQLRKSREHLQGDLKVLRQHDAWHPHDPKTTFLTEHLNRRIAKHNEVSERIVERVRS